MRRLFGTAGIRGRYLEEVSPHLAVEVGMALATYVKASKVVIGGDGRLTTPVLKLAAAVGAMTVGANAIDVGLVPLPTLAWSVRKYGGDGGIYITASHNPPTDNGIKVFTAKGMEFPESDERELEKIIREKSWRLADWDSVGKYEARLGALEDYVEEVSSKVMPAKVRRRPKVLVDTANGAPSLATPNVLRSIGADVVTLNANVDGRFPGRTPEPRPDVLEPFLPVAKDVGAHVFLAQDGDGDRLAVLDPAKGFIKQDRIIALIAKRKLEERKGTIVVSIDVGNAVRDVVEELGGKLYVVKLGKTHEGLLKNPDTLIAAEPWKLIDPSWGPWIDGIYQAGLIVKWMAEEGKDISELMSEVPNYPQARYSLKMPKHVRDQVFETMKDELLRMAGEDSEIITIDGLRVNFPDRSWLLIRKSGTEPKIRIYGEAESPQTLEAMINKLVRTATSTLRKLGVKEVKVEGKIIP